MNQQSFEQKLVYGKEAEEIIFDALKECGAYAIPKYDYVREGAPSLFGLNNRYAVPDIDTALNGIRLWVEVKRKRERNAYPDTGFNRKNLDEYYNVQNITGSKVFIIFLDEKLNKVYGNWLNNLLSPTTILHKGHKLEYPLSQKDQFGRVEIYFPTSKMLMLGDYTNNKIYEDSIKNLKKILFQSETETINRNENNLKEHDFRN